MRLLVTGATGFIGGHVVRRCVQEGHEVTATGRDHNRLEALRVTGVRTAALDLASDPLDDAVRECEAVVHCAALAAPWGARDDFWRANVVATERLIAACQERGVRRLVHVSTPSIYFRTRDQYDIPEAFEPPRRWPTYYAETKWEAEVRVRAAAERGLEAVILRPRAVFGPGDTAIMPRILAVAKSGRFPLVGGGRSLIDLTYVDNVVSAILQALTVGPHALGRSYNLSNGAPRRARELLQTIFRALGCDVRLISIPRPLALGIAHIAERIARMRRNQPEPRITVYGVGMLGFSQTLDISAARRDLRYEPHVSVDDGVWRYAQWYRRT